MSGLGGNSGKGGAGANVDGGGLDLSDQTDGNSPDVPITGTTAVKLVVGPPVIMMMEGSTTPGMLSVALDRPYSQPITVSIVSANPNVATVIPETVTFLENSIAPQMVQVLAPVDDDTLPNSTTLTVFSQETGSATVTVNVDDPDVQGLLATPPMLSMTEGRTESVGIRLAKKPASAVVVTLASSNVAKLTLGPASLTFNASNYSVPQNVSLAAQQDDDAMAEHVTVKATATGNIKDLTVMVDIIDDDAVNLDISPSSLMLVERSMKSGEIKIALTRAPATDTTVNVVSSNTAKVTVSPALVTFTVANFATPQTITVSPVDDDDARDDTAMVTFSSAGIDSRTVSVSVDDPDNQSLKVTPAMLNVAEGQSATFTVALALKPDGDTAVSVFSQNPGKLQVVPPVLHFDATDFAVGKTVTVQALEDDDLAADNVNLTLISSTTANVNIPVKIDDNDQQSLILIPAGGGSSLVMQESRTGGPESTSALGVRLAYRPSDLVTIAFSTTGASPGAAGKLTSLPSAVTFVPSDFATPKFITLTAPHDIDMLDDDVVLTAAASGLPSSTLPVKVLDVDVQNLDLSGNPGVLALTEHSLPTAVGSMANLVVKLNVQPPSNVTVNFVSSSSKVSVPASCVINGGAASGNAYMTGCTVSVAAVPDNDGRDETATITVTASVAGAPLTPRAIPVTVDDTDTQALVVSASSVGPIDEGGTGTFMVGLKLNPVDPVNVTVFPSDPTHFSVSPPTLTFSSMTAQMVTVTALNDDDMKSYGAVASDMEKITIQGAAAGAPPVSIDVSELNKDVQAVVVTPSPSLTILEGSMPQLGVRLAYRPEANERVSIASGDFTKLLVGGGASTAMDFTPGNYAATQYLTLTALPDSNLGSHDVFVTFTSPTSPNPTVDTVTITDADQLNFVVSQTSALSLPEKAPPLTTATFTVTLTESLPASQTVTAKVSSGDPTSVTAFFPSNTTMCTFSHDVPSCVVNLTVLDDANAANENVTITVSDTNTGSGALAPRTVNVTTLDNDTQALVVSAAGSTLIIHEKNTAASGPANNATTFTVRLQAQPPGDTKVDLFVNPVLGDGISISPSTVTFTKDGWKAPGTSSPSDPGDIRTITVTGIPDNDLRTDPFSIRITSATLGVPDQFVNVSEVDDDTQHIVLYSAASNTCGAVIPETTSVLGNLPETSTGKLQFCVSLSNQPLSNTVVDIAINPDTSIVSPASVALQFTTATSDGTSTGWGDKHLVTLTSDVDDNVVNGMGSISLTSSGFAATRSLTFTTTDIDPQGLAFFPSGPISIAAGGSTVVTIKPTKDPLSTITVTCTSDNGAVVLGTGSYMFSGGMNGSWKTAKNVSLSVPAATALVDVNVICTIMDLVPTVSQTLVVHAGN